MNGEEKVKEKKEENSLLTSCFIKKYKTKPRDKKVITYKMEKETKSTEEEVLF